MLRYWKVLAKELLTGFAFHTLGVNAGHIVLLLIYNSHVWQRSGQLVGVPFPFQQGWAGKNKAPPINPLELRYQGLQGLGFFFNGEGKKIRSNIAITNNRALYEDRCMRAGTLPFLWSNAAVQHHGINTLILHRAKQLLEANLLASHEFGAIFCWPFHLTVWLRWYKKVCTINFPNDQWFYLYIPSVAAGLLAGYSVSRADNILLGC